MKRKILYLAGPMEGSPDMGRAFFNERETWLIEMGYTVLNPACLPLGMDGDQYMPICLAMLEQADAIYLIGDYISSRGAMLELHYAQAQGKTVLVDGLSDMTEGF